MDVDRGSKYFASPGRTQVPEYVEARLLHFRQHLLIEFLVIITAAIPLFYQWSRILKHIHRILVKTFTGSCPRDKFKMMRPHLHLLAACCHQKMVQSVRDSPTPRIIAVASSMTSAKE